MNEHARRWRIVIAGTAAGLAGVVSLAATPANAEPLPPHPVLPAPVTVTQTVTVAPQAAAPLIPAAAAPAQPIAAGSPAAPAAIPAVPVAPGAAPLLGSATSTAATPRPVTVPLSPNPSGTIRDYLTSQNVTLEPQTPAGFTALNIVLPRPTGWTQVPDPNVPDAFAVIADRVGGDGLYSNNAQVVVYKLVGNFDQREAIRHGFVDSQQLTAWRATGGSIAEVAGVPTSIIEGTYRENNMTLNTSRRHIIATSGADRFLVSLSVTTSESQSVAAADATDAIINGFRVSAPAPAAPAPGAAAAPAAAAPVVPAPAAAAPSAIPVSLGTGPVVPN
ncbi:LpqN/LpqT family lipoprotein [Mycolicibacterium neoaurum]|uniref:LpqN/LpqT family lipoprotein n=1 Tax=Mycolicibacterium neoaurum TaxID=1795 RepID=UPI00248B9783|nr:LpqN/LpqT family lipoprotein [Mycolicibacterium neoaurum]WBP93384.1 LpqN/LpqT family lipoprotein [Mycolicibacterium neoaurum]WBS06941.1 LpqN/LpqT family lipoprotein [Mycolicibacterium neoaurum]